MLGLWKSDGDAGVVLDGFAADEEEDDEQKRDVTHACDGQSHGYASLFSAAAHGLFFFDRCYDAAIGADGGEGLKIRFVGRAFGGFEQDDFFLAFLFGEFEGGEALV